MVGIFKPVSAHTVGKCDNFNLANYSCLKWIILSSLNNKSKRVLSKILLDYIVIALYSPLTCSICSLLWNPDCESKFASMMKIRCNLPTAWVVVYSLKVSQSYLHTVLSVGHIWQPILWMITSKRLHYLSRTETWSDLRHILTPSFWFELKEPICCEERWMSWLGAVGSDATMHHYQGWDTRWLWICCTTLFIRINDEPSHFRGGPK